MKMRTWKCISVLAGVWVWLAAGPVCHADVVAFQISVDTSSLVGLGEGVLDFQFNAGGTSTGSASATISAFASDGTLDTSAPAFFEQGNVTGNLPGNVTLVDDPSSSVNEYSPGFTYGNTLQFDVTLSLGNPPDTGGTFLFYLLDGDSDDLLVTDPNSPDGRALDLVINAAPCSGLSCVTIDNYSQDLTVTPLAEAPEPSSILLLLTACAAIGILIRRKATSGSPGVSCPEGSVWRCAVDGGCRLQLTTPTLRAINPRWVPDGSLIAFYGAEPEFYGRRRVRGNRQR